MTEITEKLKELLYRQGASLVGVGSLNEIPEEAHENMLFGISIALAINPEIINGIEAAPTQDYYKAYKELNQNLDELVEIGAEYIKACGYRAKPQTITAVVLDDAGLSTILPHKTIATRAGLGWIGKCALLVTKEFGSAVRISSILTDAPLIADAPVNESFCGACTACEDACPGQAVKGINWNVHAVREDFFDAVKCKKASREIALKNVSIEMSLCGKCIQVCPYTRKYIKKTIDIPS